MGERRVRPGLSAVGHHPTTPRATETDIRPRAGVGLVPRDELVDALAGSEVRVVALVAGPGYGKTTLLSRWADRLDGAAGWHSCTSTDNDPAALLAALGLAGDLGSGIATVADLVAAAARSEPDRILIIDDLQTLTSAASLNVLSDVIDRLPAGWRVAVASRVRPRLPLARLRAAGNLLEIGEDALSLSSQEEARVLAWSGVSLAPEAMAALHARTTGWPAGASLAGMAIHDGSGDPGTFSGDDRFVREYLRTEVLSGLRARETTLLLRCSILDELSGPVCDAVLRTHSSGAVLEHLETHSVVRPVGRDGEWFRCHPLLRDLLRAEVSRKEPGLVPELHRRASAWFADHGEPGLAIEHAHLAGDVEELARLVLAWAQLTWASGDIETVQHWMSWLEEANGIRSFPGIAAHAALIFALLGEPARAERWSELAMSAAHDGILSDGTTVEATLAYLSAIEARHGVEQMRQDAGRGSAGMPPTSPFRATMLHTAGLASLLEGDLDAADDLFVDALEAGELGAIHPLVAMVLCERATVAVERGDWAFAVPAVRRAVTIVADGRYGSYWSSALVHAWAGRVAVHLGQHAEAVEHIRDALALRPLLTRALPVVSTQALVTAGQASLGLGDLRAASSLARQAQEIMRRRPGLGDLPDKVADLDAQVHEAASQRPDRLTPAEARLMPLLATHLTFPLIAERLGLSRNTVKTQAISSYRKLGVSSRSEAVASWERLEGARNP